MHAVRLRDKVKGSCILLHFHLLIFGHFRKGIVIRIRGVRKWRRLVCDGILYQNLSLEHSIQINLELLFQVQSSSTKTTTFKPLDASYIRMLPWIQAISSINMAREHIRAINSPVHVSYLANTEQTAHIH